MVPAGVGSVSETPVGGIGDGRGTSMFIAPVEICAGVAPTASTDPVAVPVMAVFPKAAAADAMLAGIVSVVWYPVRLNGTPDAGSGGVMVPVVSTLFSAMLPTGVPGQSSS